MITFTKLYLLHYILGLGMYFAVKHLTLKTQFLCVICVRHTGVLLISLALCADAAIGNVQEKAMKLHNGSNSEMVHCLIS